MGKIIRNRQIVEDSWLPLEEGPEGDLAVTEGAQIVVPLAAWQRHREALLVHTGGLGVKLQADSPLGPIAPDLGHFAMIAVHIPKFGDGRGLSLARLLRERHGFTGELRAVGEVLIDQLADMRRCGFDAFELRADQNLEKALVSFHPFTESYQSSVDSPLPLFRRRAL